MHSSTGGMMYPKKQKFTRTSEQPLQLIKHSKAAALALKATAQKAPDFLIMRFQKQVKVEGIGEYTIEVTNLIDPKTMQV